MLPSLIRNPGLEYTNNQGRETKENGNADSNERRHDHISSPTLALKPPPDAATGLRVEQLVVQIRQPVGEIQVGYVPFAVLSDGGELEADNIGVEGAGRHKRLQEFAGSKVRKGEQNTLEGIEDFKEKLAWEDAPGFLN